MQKYLCWGRSSCSQYRVLNFFAFLDFFQNKSRWKICARASDFSASVLQWQWRNPAVKSFVNQPQKWVLLRQWWRWRWRLLWPHLGPRDQLLSVTWLRWQTWVESRGTLASSYKNRQKRDCQSPFRVPWLSDVSFHPARLIQWVLPSMQCTYGHQVCNITKLWWTEWPRWCLAISTKVINMVLFSCKNKKRCNDDDGTLICDRLNYHEITSPGQLPNKFKVKAHHQICKISNDNYKVRCNRFQL